MIPLTGREELEGYAMLEYETIVDSRLRPYVCNSYNEQTYLLVFIVDQNLVGTLAGRII